MVILELDKSMVVEDIGDIFQNQEEKIKKNYQNRKFIKKYIMKLTLKITSLKLWQINILLFLII